MFQYKYPNAQNISINSYHERLFYLKSLSNENKLSK